MPTAAPDTSALLALLAQAAAEADRLGPAGVSVRHHLDEAAAEARSVAARDGKPDEGIPVDALTTENDK